MTLIMKCLPNSGILHPFLFPRVLLVPTLEKRDVVVAVSQAAARLCDVGRGYMLRLVKYTS